MSIGTYIFQQEIGTDGPGDDQFGLASGICSDSVHFYVVDATYDRIKKHKISDMSYVSKLGTIGSGDSNFADPRDIDTDGTYLYIADEDNHRIKVHLASDLSYVDDSGDLSGSGYYRPNGIAVAGNFVYVVVYDSVDSMTYLQKRNKSDFGLVVSRAYTNKLSIRPCANDDFVWFFDNSKELLQKLNSSDLTTANETFFNPTMGVDDLTGLALGAGSGLWAGTLLFGAARSDDKIYVLKSGNLDTLDSFGPGDSGSVDLDEPITLTIEGNHIYVMDYRNNRVVDFTYLPPALEKTPESFNFRQDGDVLFTMTPDGGEMSTLTGVTEMTRLYESFSLICLMGGNREDNGTASTANKQYMGNEDEEGPRRLRSRFQALLYGRPMTSQLISELGAAAGLDIADGLGNDATAIRSRVSIDNNKTVTVTTSVELNSGTFLTLRNEIYNR